MIYFDNPTTALKVKVAVNGYEEGGTGKIAIYNSTSAAASSITLSSGLNIVKLAKDSGVKKLVISHNSKNTSIKDALYIHQIKVTNGFNSVLDDPHITMSGTNSVLSTIRSLATSDGKDMFNYLNIPDNSKKMDISDILEAGSF